MIFTQAVVDALVAEVAAEASPAIERACNDRLIAVLDLLIKTHDQRCRPRPCACIFRELAHSVIRQTATMHLVKGDDES